jgi:hypothetical protein
MAMMSIFENIKITLEIHYGWGLGVAIIKIFEYQKAEPTFPIEYICKSYFKSENGTKTVRCKIPQEDIQVLFELINKTKITPIVNGEQWMDSGWYKLKLVCKNFEANYLWDSVPSRSSWAKLNKIADKIEKIAEKITGFSGLVNFPQKSKNT